MNCTLPRELKQQWLRVWLGGTSVNAREHAGHPSWFRTARLPGGDAATASGFRLGAPQGGKVRSEPTARLPGGEAATASGFGSGAPQGREVRSEPSKRLKEQWCRVKGFPLSKENLHDSTSRLASLLRPLGPSSVPSSGTGQRAGCSADATTTDDGGGFQLRVKG